MAAKGQVSPEVFVMQKLAKEGFIAELKERIDFVNMHLNQVRQNQR
jgi:hypothetical protein